MCRAIQKQIAIRVICAYRTVSAEAALLLARATPVELLARERAAVFGRLRAVSPTPLDVGEVYAAETVVTRRLWFNRIQQPNLAGRSTRDLIVPVFDRWMDRRMGDYRST